MESSGTKWFLTKEEKVVQVPMFPGKSWNFCVKFPIRESLGKWFWSW